MQQSPPGYWHIFDDDDKDKFRINSPHFVSAQAVDQEKIQRLVIDNPEITTKADTIAALAERIGVPAKALADTVSEFNDRVKRGESTEVGGVPAEDTPPVFTIDTAPFYAMRSYPMANKSAGGISIDLGARALDGEGNPVPRLYAAGEVTGSAGINGLNGLDGMFTGPAILTGRVAGRTAIGDLASEDDRVPRTFERDADMTIASIDKAESGSLPRLGADDVRAMLAISRDGYWHFERVHNMVLERNYPCTQCHSATVPFAPALSRAERLAQTETCNSCHLAPVGTLDPTSNQGAAPKPD
jgi:hypothetical protein